ncbi:RICIN domain-containing protein [Nocardia sp. CS682]|uniref:RICIN domain-containing protein n=1 Tax=Nocardia sp. CS682 TaxID=1047172 RepID=UPI001075897C|nr:RICIN domain-containing protein [Nocardia sp. CS682]QBS44460.1 hypothetical protein DMB37_34620 [Nocardia sp. CS682]
MGFQRKLGSSLAVIGLTVLTGGLLTGTAFADWPADAGAFRIASVKDPNKCVASDVPAGQPPQVIRLLNCDPAAADQQWVAADGKPKSRLRNVQKKGQCINADGQSAELFALIALSCKTGLEFVYQPDKDHPHVGTIVGKQPNSAKKFCWELPVEPEHKAAAMVPCRNGEIAQLWRVTAVG